VREGLWVRRELMPDGTYGATIAMGDDAAFSLTRQEVWEYAAACRTLAMQAEYDMAVVRLLMSEVGLSESDVGGFVLRHLAPHHHPPGPLLFNVVIGRSRPPMVDAGEYKSVVRLWWQGTEIGQCSLDDLRAHGGAVLDVLAAAECDQIMHRSLVTEIGLRDTQARMMVQEVRNFYEPKTKERCEQE
jgi:hypothetical protein